jgi:hypothetical protein
MHLRDDAAIFSLTLNKIASDALAMTHKKSLPGNPEGIF